MIDEVRVVGVTVEKRAGGSYQHPCFQCEGGGACRAAQLVGRVDDFVGKPFCGHVEQFGYVFHAFVERNALLPHDLGRSVYGQVFAHEDYRSVHAHHVEGVVGLQEIGFAEPAAAVAGRQVVDLAFVRDVLDEYVAVVDRLMVVASVVVAAPVAQDRGVAVLVAGDQPDRGDLVVEREDVP